MADQDLTITGKDVSVEMLVDAVPMKLADKVVRFTERAVYQRVESRHLGTSDVDIDTEPDGWEGEIEISRKTSALDDFVDAYNLARANRVPVLILITSTKRYRDGTSKTHTYLDCKIEFSTDAQRGQAVTSRMPWRSGKQRV